MIIYLYDADTGAYLGEGVAHESPREPGVFLQPAFATFDAPPGVGNREVACFVDGAWVISPDWRGVPLWDTASGEPVVILRPGVTPVEIGATDIERTDPTTVWDGVCWVPDPTLIDQQLTDQRAEQNATIKSHLAELDSRSIRTLHEALLELAAAGASLSSETIARLQALEDQKTALRVQLLPE